MKRSRVLMSPLRAAAWVCIVAAIFGGLAAVSRADKETAKRKHSQRTGDQLYTISCARCHSERYPTERTDAQWETIMLHMRTRAQIPAKDAEKILEYLKENN